MATLSGFVAYPSNPPQVGEAIRAALDRLRDTHGISGFAGWEQNDVAGSFLAQPILDNIEASDVLVADITKLNFNVVYEIGYAIGKRKRAFLTLNSSLEGDQPLVREVGLFDTLGYTTYEDAAHLASLVSTVDRTPGIAFDDTQINRKAPVYLVLPQHKTDLEIHITSRIKKARLRFRQFDPEELGRLSAREAIDNVASSFGVVIPLLPFNRQDAVVHNLRAAYVAGLSGGMSRISLLLQAGFEPIPLDYRDVAQVFTSPGQANEYIAEFATQITEELQRDIEPAISETKSFLARMTLGSSIAENELRDLHEYYIQ